MPLEPTKLKSKIRNSLVRFDIEGLIKSEAIALIGVDEAGRGAWAGPLVAAAVFIKRELYDSKPFLQKLRLVNDSKQLIEETREEIYFELEQLQRKQSIRLFPGFASIEEITEHNIVGATKLAMRRALSAVLSESEIIHDSECNQLFSLNPGPVVWVDGRPLKGLGYPHKAWVKGDGLSFSIALASIVAKVTRDRHMKKLDALYPQYGFAKHKGYGTPQHQAAIRAHGLSPVHRPSFDTSVCFQESGEEVKA
jgi:ribonuclease HII